MSKGNYYKNHPSFYKPSEVKTVFGKLVERDVLRDEETGAEWRFLHAALEERIVKGEPDACWGWKGAYHRQGYGLFNIRRNDGFRNAEKGGKLVTRTFGSQFYLDNYVLIATQKSSVICEKLGVNPVQAHNLKTAVRMRLSQGRLPALPTS
jgi:hypothetical protein